jgi:two-component system, OmpR family, response regulator MprA
MMQMLATDAVLMTEPRTILVVDDEPGVRQSLTLALELESFRVLAAENGLRAMSEIEDTAIDAIVLDVAMPFLDGLEVCRRLRSAGNQVPILMLTAKDDERVAGLEAGADDYLPKPFALSELVARLRAIMRRSLADSRQSGGVLAYADLRLDRAAHRVWRGDRLLELTRTEFLLLECFLVHSDLVLTRAQIQQRVWGYDFGAEHGSLGVYVGYLRRKLEAHGEPRLIHTVRSVGYVLRREP